MIGGIDAMKEMLEFSAAHKCYPQARHREEWEGYYPQGEAQRGVGGLSEPSDLWVPVGSFVYISLL